VTGVEVTIGNSFPAVREMKLRGNNFHCYTAGQNARLSSVAGILPACLRHLGN